MTRSQSFAEARAHALRSPCTYCGAAVNEPCRHKHTGKLLEHFPAHEIRTRGWHPPRLVHDQDAEDRRRAAAEQELANITPAELPFTDDEEPPPPSDEDAPEEEIW